MRSAWSHSRAVSSEMVKGNSLSVEPLDRGTRRQQNMVSGSLAQRLLDTWLRRTGKRATDGKEEKIPNPKCEAMVLGTMPIKD